MHFCVKEASSLAANQRKNVHSYRQTRALTLGSNPGFWEMSHLPSLKLGLGLRLGLGLCVRLWEGWVSGLWEISHPHLPEDRVRVKVGVGFICRFMGGVG